MMYRLISRTVCNSGGVELPLAPQMFLHVVYKTEKKTKDTDHRVTCTVLCFTNIEILNPNYVENHRGNSVEDR